MKGGWQEASTSGRQDGQIWEGADRSGGKTDKSTVEGVSKIRRGVGRLVKGEDRQI